MGRSMFAVVVSTLIVSALCAQDPNGAEEQYPDAYAKNAWGEIRYDLTEIVDRLCKQDALPDSSIWTLLREDKKSNGHRINRLMDEALSHLEICRLGEYRQEYASLGEKISKNRELIGQQMEKMVAAPQKTGMVSGLWTKSREEYERRIEELEVEVQSCEKRQEKIVEEMRREMARIGIDISEQQMTNLLLSVAGDTFLDISACFHNIKQLTDIIAGLIAENEDYVQNAQKYYGMYASLVGILVHANERAQEDIRKRYIPEIEDIVRKVEETRERTQNLIKSNSGDRDTLARLHQNLEVQNIVLKAGDLYAKHLREQLAKLGDAEAKLHKHRDVALNTYETINLASKMLSIIKESLEELQTVQNMQLPDIVPLETEQIRLQFEQISEQLRLAK